MLPSVSVSMESLATQRKKQKDASQRRLRASRACIRCNNRKVRCDMLSKPFRTINNTPSRCTNCHLDDEPCIIRPTKRRKGASHRYNAPANFSMVDGEKELFDLSNSVATNPVQDTTTASSLLPGMENLPEGMPCANLNLPTYYSETALSTMGKDFQVGEAICSINGITQHFENEMMWSWSEGEGRSPGLDGHLIFSYFNFLQFDELSVISPEDARTLEVNGCLHIPIRSTLDIIVREYFLHVHPSLPILDEGRFWNVYRNKDRRSNSPRTSLFLFQAMLFASCSYVTLDTLQTCGYKTTQEAQKTLYSRAKCCSIVKLNMMRQPLRKESARADHAHYYDTDKSLTKYERQMKKRLWWCCVLRDRILPLGVRRPLQITHNHLNSAGQELTEEDLEEEIGKSEVYDTETQHLLVKLLLAQCKLAVELTDVITMVYPADGANLVTMACEDDFNRVSIQTKGYEMKLTDWYNAIDQWIPTVLGKSHASITLFASLLYIYYHSARLALCHHKIFALETWTSLLGRGQDTYIRQLDLFRGELCSSAASVTCIVQDLLHLNLGQYMPISAVAYTALPLVISALDVKMSPSSSQSRVHYLETYRKSIELYSKRYNGIDTVSYMMERILEEAESNSRNLCHLSSHFSRQDSNHSSSNTSDWFEIFVKHPKLHLRVAFSFDLSFSNGKFPEDSDFPKQLRADQLEEYPHSHETFIHRETNLTADALTPLYSYISTPIFDNTVSESLQTTAVCPNLDFMDLFGATTPGHIVDISSDMDSGARDASLDLLLPENNTEKNCEDDSIWEKVIWDLFDLIIPA
ncbi:hypothetical protein V496_03069 [Pseudogymnoascus sp. VKM F-4515 (FW-2607)]|nr:hypothetical protein V496_03069 [Pseudogymnoascus sp. VKM F-4515 (FW-2607)]